MLAALILHRQQGPQGGKRGLKRDIVALERRVRFLRKEVQRFNAMAKRRGIKTKENP